MNWFEKILAALDGRMTTPTLFGWFHIMWLLIIVGITVTLCVFAFKNRGNMPKNYKLVKIVVLTYAILTILLEIYKQLNYSFNSTTGEWGYQWYAFPFQFCSTPMYVALIAGCLKDGSKFQKWLYSYLATFSLFAGLAVMIYPGDVFISTIGINIQTMICHGGMVVVGVVILASKVVDLNYKTVLRAIPVFATLALIALIANIIFHTTGNTATFNMFYISPYLPCTLPILNAIYPVVPYPVFLLIYLLGFSLAATVIFSFAFVGELIIKKCQNNKAKALVK